MELRTYWSIIWRRIWVIALVFGLVAIYVGYSYYHLRKTQGALKSYSSAITVQIELLPSAMVNSSNADNVSVTSTLADSLTTGPILQSHEFDQDVIQQISQDTSEITQKYGANADLGNWQNNPSGIGGALTATRVNNLVTISVNWSTSAGAWAIANAVGEVSSTKLGNFLNVSVSSSGTPTASTSSGTTVVAQPNVSARVVSAASDPATIAGSSSSKITLYLALLVVGLALGLALAFLLEYLDDRIRSREQVENLLGLPILGELPRAPQPGRK
ncbi:MAG TPA: hypothetical protein VKT25_01115 [Ktedonobacteraceae bacterium]|nr:hypothetical protein [Ktedonobacteraceae bacterium]